MVNDWKNSRYFHQQKLVFRAISRKFPRFGITGSGATCHQIPKRTSSQILLNLTQTKPFLAQLLTTLWCEVNQARDETRCERKLSNFSILLRYFVRIRNVLECHSRNLCKYAVCHCLVFRTRYWLNEILVAGPVGPD